MTLTFRQKMKDLLALNSMALGHYQVDQDPLEGKIQGQFREDLIRDSIQVGQEEAGLMKEKYPGLRPLQIINRLGIDFQRKGENNGLEYIEMAYFQEPNEIVIYDDNVKKVENLLKGTTYDIFEDPSLEDIVLAHELFHFVESEKENLYTNTVQVKLFSLGPFTRKSTMICPGEIAGMSFAKELLNVEYDPSILNYPFMYAWYEEVAEGIYQGMMKYKDY